MRKKATGKATPGFPFAFDNEVIVSHFKEIPNCFICIWSQQFFLDERLYCMAQGAKLATICYNSKECKNLHEY